MSSAPFLFQMLPHAQEPIIDPKPKRKRLTIACERCRRRKVRCDGGRPSCSGCVRHSNECIYPTEVKKRGPRPGQTYKDKRSLHDDGHTLTKQLTSDSAESNPMLQRMPSNGGLGDAIHRPGIDRARTPDAYMRHHAMVAPSQYSGASELPAPYGMYGNMHMQSNPAMQQYPHAPLQYSDSPMDPFGLPLSQQSNHSMQSADVLIYPTLVPTPTLPIGYAVNQVPPHLATRLVDVYFSRVNPHFAFIHPRALRLALARNAIPPCLLNSMFAVAIGFLLSESVDNMQRTPSQDANSQELGANMPYLNGSDLFDNWAAADSFAEAARYELDQNRKVVSIAAVQSYLNLACYALRKASWKQAQVYNGIAIRLAQEIMLHRVDDRVRNDRILADIQEPEQAGIPWNYKAQMEQMDLETRRRLWWACFMFDRFTTLAPSLCSLKPAPMNSLMVDDRDCVVRLPCSDHHWYSEALALNERGELFDADELDTSCNDTHANQRLNMAGLHADYGDLRFAKMSLRGHLVRLTTILGKIILYQNEYCSHHDMQMQSNGLDYDKEVENICPQFVQLDNLMTAWFQLLPIQYADPADVEDPCVNFSHALFYTSRIILQQAVKPKYISIFPQHTETCLQAADAITKIVALVLARDAVEKQNPFFFFCTFVASKTYLTRMISTDTHHKDKSSPASTTLEQDIASLNVDYTMNHRDHLLQCVKLLRIASRMCGAAKLYLDILSFLVDC